MSGRPLLRLATRSILAPSSRCLRTASKRPLMRDGPAHLPCRPQVRYSGSFTRNAGQLFRMYPFHIALASVTIVVGMGTILYANYVYQTYIIGAFHKYPEPVAEKLRRALYFTNIDLQPKEAVKYYKQALQLAEELRMDPISDEVIGVKIQVAALMEKVEQWHKAIEVLERTRNDNLAWLEQYGGLEHNKMRRTGVLGKTVGISVKLGELYSHPSIWNRDMAVERLVWAVETVLTEQQRRQTTNAQEEVEGKWMTNEEIGAALEALAHGYEAQDQHYLATPLFLQALALYPVQDCHTVVLMNNLASSLAQQSPRAARAAQAFATSKNINESPVGPLATRESLVENARTWAQKALGVAAGITPPLRTEECDIGCAVATHNLGEFAEMRRDITEARKRYQEAISLSRAVGFEEGIENSSARLRALANAG